MSDCTTANRERRWWIAAHDPAQTTFDEFTTRSLTDFVRDSADEDPDE